MRLRGLLEELDAGLARHALVGDDEVDALGALKHAHRLGAVHRAHDLTLIVEHRLEHVEVRSEVVNDQHRATAHALYAERTQFIPRKTQFAAGG